MARIKGPLMSVEASGQWGGALLFRKGKAGGHVSRLPAADARGTRPATQAQLAVRSRYTQGREAWNALTSDQRAVWMERAETDPRPITGFNLFMQRSMSNPSGILEFITGDQRSFVTEDGATFGVSQS